MTTPKYLVIPTTPEAWIPLGMSLADYELMMAAIALYAHKIAPPQEPTYMGNPIHPESEPQENARSMPSGDGVADEKKLESL